MSIANAVSDVTFVLNHDTDPFPKEICTHNLNSEFENLESTEGVDSAQVATATLHKDWLDIKSDDVSVQKGLSNLFSSGRAQKEKLRNEKIQKACEASAKYYAQGEPRKLRVNHHADLTKICQI